jgi:hypothetical protein
VWFNDEVNRAPIFCDISVKLQIGGEVGRIASVMCIARFLAEVVSPRATAITRQDRRRRAIFDYSMCFGAPALVMASHIVYGSICHRPGDGVHDHSEHDMAHHRTLADLAAHLCFDRGPVLWLVPSRPTNPELT